MTVAFRFYGHLNNFLSPLRRGRRFVQQLHARASAKDAMYEIGVPASQVDVIVVNGTPVDFTYRLHDGDMVAVYPPFRSIDLGDTVRAS
jgi:molybdopterin converting factor small subunit